MCSLLQISPHTLCLNEKMTDRKILIRQQEDGNLKKYIISDRKVKPCTLTHTYTHTHTHTHVHTLTHTRTACGAYPQKAPTLYPAVSLLGTVLQLL